MKNKSFVYTWTHRHCNTLFAWTDSINLGDRGKHTALQPNKNMYVYIYICIVRSNVLPSFILKGGLKALRSWQRKADPNLQVFNPKVYLVLHIAAVRQKCLSYGCDYF